MERISAKEYANVIKACLEIAVQDTGGARVMAQVLLSAYNGDSFQLDVASLSNLDQENYGYALAVIRGRSELGIEPHELIANGSKVFRDLWTQWQRLELVERAKRTCPDCDGRGKIYPDPYNDDLAPRPCERCAGTGRICRCGKSILKE